MAIREKRSVVASIAPLVNNLLTAAIIPMQAPTHTRLRASVESLFLFLICSVVKFSNAGEFMLVSYKNVHTYFKTKSSRIGKWSL